MPPEYASQPLRLRSDQIGPGYGILTHARDALVDAAHCEGIILDSVRALQHSAARQLPSPTAASTARTAPFFSTLGACLACPATTSYMTRNATRSAPDRWPPCC